MSKETIIFYKEWLTLINSLPDKSRLEFYDLIFSQDKVVLSKIKDAHLRSVLDFVQQKIDKNHVKYEKVISKRKLAGIKSGEARRKKGTSVQSVQQKGTSVQSVQQEGTKRTDSDNVNDNVSDNVNDNDYSKNNICRKSGDSRPNENNEDEISKKKINEEFEKVWRSYLPVKTSDGGFTPKGDKKPALAEFEKIYRKTKDPNVFEEISTGIENYLRQCSNSGTKTKHFVRFLRNETWKDHQSFDETTIMAKGASPPMEEDSPTIEEIAKEVGWC